MKKQLSIVNAINDLLDLRSQSYSKLDEDLIKEILNKDDSLKKDLSIISAMSNALNLRKSNPSLTKREIINQILE